MTQVGPTNYNPIPIGEIAKPPFARSPDPLAMFARRAARLRVLASGHELNTYLMFLADLCDVQHRLQPGLPDAELPPADAIARSRQFRMPPAGPYPFRARWCDGRGVEKAADDG